MAELIVALDVGNESDAISLANELSGAVSWLKIGLELFLAAGPSLLVTLKKLNFHIFLDLKFYDIPNTVFQAVKTATRYHADMLTVHCQGGKKMCEAAMKAACDTSLQLRPLVIGVTALTSFEDGEMPGIPLPLQVYGTFLASRAAQWGLPGVVCSGHETELIKKENPSLICICPGIRLNESESDDQSRIMTPELAVKAGADYLVIGRPIRESFDPRAKTLEILEQMSGY